MSRPSFPENHSMRGLYQWACAQLGKSGSDSPEHEALLMCIHCLGISGRADIIAHGDIISDQTAVRKLYDCVMQRESRPLQYILGEWDFCGLGLAVGEGVLIPRDDTAALVEAVCGCAEDMMLSRESVHGDVPLSFRILDLCAGSGAVGLACIQRIRRLNPSAHVEVTCAELSEKAMPYLEENVRRFGGGLVFTERADVLVPPDPAQFPPDRQYDIICSNPPYIPSGDIDGLAREVRQEPRMALDGGNDGLLFYRAISAYWRSLLKKGGVLAFEIGIGMEHAVRDIMSGCFENINCKKDLSGHIRTIYGTHKS